MGSSLVVFVALFCVILRYESSLKHDGRAYNLKIRAIWVVPSIVRTQTVRLFLDDVSLRNLWSIQTLVK